MARPICLYPWPRLMRVNFLVWSLFVAACRGSTQIGAQGVAANTVEASPATSGGVEHLYRSTESGLRDSLRLVIRDSEALKDLWRQVRARDLVAKDPPGVDFEGSSVVVAALGERPTASEWIAIDSSFVREGTRIVSVTRFTVEANCPGGQMITSPVELAAIPNDGHRVQFMESSRVLPHCGGGRPAPPPLIP